jgi:hypothetical protein
MLPVFNKFIGYSAYWSIDPNNHGIAKEDIGLEVTSNGNFR